MLEKLNSVPFISSPNPGGEEEKQLVKSRIINRMKNKSRFEDQSS
jgi:hypothetical protein